MVVSDYFLHASDYFKLHMTHPKFRAAAYREVDSDQCWEGLALLATHCSISESRSRLQQLITLWSNGSSLQTAVHVALKEFKA